MITELEKTEIKEILGKNYISKIMARFKELGISKPDGSEFSRRTIVHTINEKGQDRDAIEGIYRVVLEVKKQDARIKQMRKELLSEKTEKTNN